MDVIANAAGVSKQTVYSHFENKEALFRECILTKIRDYGLDMEDFPVDQPLAATLTETGRRFLSLLADDEVIAMHRLMISDTADFSHLANSFWETGPAATIANLTNYIRANTERGFSVVTEPESAASDFLTLVEGHYLKQRLMLQAEALNEKEKLARAQAAALKICRLYDDQAVA